jgi:4'-phosphopantetheinyl transferase
LGARCQDRLTWHGGDGPDSLQATEVNAWRLSLSVPFSASQRDLCRRYLRTLLGRYLGVAPEAVRFETGRFGKPGLDRKVHAQDIQFNVTHSGTIALIVLATGRRVGIDVQQGEPLADVEDLSARFLSPHEHESVMSLPADERNRAFLACWVRKEAAIKALGRSITQCARTEVVPADSGDSWELRDLPIDAGYAAALCYENPPAEIRLWTAVQGSACGGSTAERCRE